MEECHFQKESNTPPWVFSRFLNCTNGTKSRKASDFFFFELKVQFMSDILNTCKVNRGHTKDFHELFRSNNLIASRKQFECRKRWEYAKYTPKTLRVDKDAKRN